MGLLIPLTFARHRLSHWLFLLPVCTFSTDNGRRWLRIYEFYTANFKGIFGGPWSEYARAIGCPQTYFFPHEITIFWPTKKRRKDTFFHPPSPFPGNFCNCNSGGICSFPILGPGPFCFTSTEVRWLIRGGDRRGGGGGGGDERVKAWLRILFEKDRGPLPERTMEVLRRCPFTIAQQLVHCAIRINCCAWAESEGPCLGSTSIVIHSVKQRLLRNRPGRDVMLRPLAWKITKGIHSCKPASHSSGVVWESRWPSWAVRPNKPSGFRGRKAILNHASALVTACP